jgi:type IV pilus assembly protein PilC
MPTFRYQALDADQKSVTGQVEAESVALAVARLEAQGLIVQQIAFASEMASVSSPPQNPFAAERTGATRSALERHAGRVIEATGPLLAPLHAYAAELPQAGKRRQLERALRVIERGNAKDVAAEMERRPTPWLPLLGVTAAAGDPLAGLRKFVDQSHRARKLQRQWQWVLAYPFCLLLATVVLVTFLAFVPIPVFRNVFQDFGLRLPAFTRFVLAVASWISSGWLIAVVAGIAVAALIAWQARKLLPLGLRDWANDRFGTPLGRSTAIAGFAQSLADLVTVEPDPAAAVQIAGAASQSPRLRRAAWRLAGELEHNGKPNIEVYRATITATVLHALGSELPTASRSALLEEISRCHATRAAQSLSWTHGIVEPLLIVIVGLMMGSVVVALFMPLISLIQGLS